MHSHLIFILGLVGLAAVTAAPNLPAADVTTSYPIPVPNSYAPPDYTRSTSTATSASNAIIVVLNAQALLLKEILRDHQDQVAQLRQKNQNERAAWETELVNEFQAKIDRVQKNIDQTSQSGTATADLKAAGGSVDDELVFTSTVEARLAQIHQDLSAAIADSRDLSTQIATNKAPETISAIASVLGDNQRLVKELQREQLDLELRKLEFRILRKAMQK